MRSIYVLIIVHKLEILQLICLLIYSANVLFSLILIIFSNNFETFERLLYNTAKSLGSILFKKTLRSNFSISLTFNKYSLITL